MSEKESKPKPITKEITSIIINRVAILTSKKKDNIALRIL